MARRAPYLVVRRSRFHQRFSSAPDDFRDPEFFTGRPAFQANFPKRELTACNFKKAELLQGRVLGWRSG
jgi:hypothetical protein